MKCRYFEMRSPGGRTPLALAAAAGNAGAVRTLAAHGADPAARMRSGDSTPLVAAAANGHAEVWEQA